jgi:ABC-2 type transport system permease protein
MQELLESYPKEMMAFFPSMEEFASPVGYLDTYFSSLMTIIVGIFAVSIFAKLIVGEEEKGILDLVIAHPVSRSSLFWGRVLGAVSAIVFVLVAAWLGWVVPAESAGFEFTAWEFFLPMLPLFGILVLFGSLSLLMSMVLPAVRLASGLSGALLVGNFLLVGMSELNEDLKPVFDLTPLKYYQGAQIINDPNWGWLFGLIGVSLVFFLAAWMIFLRRDIRVGGEAGWQFSIKPRNKITQS